MREARVLLADDNALMLERVHRLLEHEFEIVGQVHDGRSLVHKARALRPDVIVIDIALPECNGIEAAREIRKQSPGMKIVFLTMHQSAGLFQDALAMGGLGYVLKSCAASDLVVAVREALAGRSYVSPRATTAAEHE